MGNYAIIGESKLKSMGNIKGVLAHMTRSRATANANGRPNDILISPPAAEQIAGRIQSYLPRKNAVLAYDFLLTASPEFFLDKTEAEIKAWERDSLAWCEETFGRENIVAAICHRDETTPHIQAVIIPEYQGKLNARHYTGGREKLRGLWTSYAHAMQKWGLQRGKLYSPAAHKDIKSYYADVNRAAELAVRGKVRPEQLPEPTLKDRVSPQEYAARLINYAIDRIRKQNANLRAGLESAKKDRESMAETAANDRELFSFLQANPEAYHQLEKELEREKDARRADKEKIAKLIKAIRVFFQKNIDARSVYRRPENLGELSSFAELKEDIRLDITPEQKPRQGMSLEL